MRGPRPIYLHLTAPQRKALEQIVRRATSPQYEVTRAQIILAADEGKNNQQIADRFDLHAQTVRTWRRRWVESAERLALIEAEGDAADGQAMIHEVLRDNPRSGTPATFTAEQICQIVAVGCEPPTDSGRPVSHWTPTELADEVVKRGIVRRISPRSVGLFLKRGRDQAASLALLVELAAG